MLTAILAFSLFGAPKPLPCPAHAMAQCADTQALAADPEFQTALRDFLGAAHERLLHGDRPLYDQVMELLAKSEQSAPKVGEDMRLFAGCRRLSCPEKAAVIVGSRGILAIGLIDYTHGEPGLEVIVQRSDATVWGPQQALRAWAEHAVSSQADHDHANTALSETRIRALQEEPAARAERRGLFSLPRL